MAAPGVAFARQVFGARDPSGIARLAGGPRPRARPQRVRTAPVLGCRCAELACHPARARHSPGCSPPWPGDSAVRRFGSRRSIAATSSRSCSSLLVVPLVTWAPYDHVREPVAEGEAYRAYFTADFVWAMTVTSELARVRCRPRIRFSRGESLHYYWMAHFLSGALYRNAAPWGIVVEQVVLIDGLAFGLAFVAFVYALARMAGASPAFAALAVAVGFLANSYEGLNRLWILYERGASFDAVTDYNIDAVTRWFYQGMPVDGLQRLLLYQPHHLTGYVMATRRALAGRLRRRRDGDVGRAVGRNPPGAGVSLQHVHRRHLQRGGRRAVCRSPAGAAGRSRDLAVRDSRRRACPGRRRPDQRSRLHRSARRRDD